jgi:hypothetical protein
MVDTEKDLPLFGFLNIYKPKGMTSHDVVGRMRRVTKIKQIGHTGTLDPFATGVLPICIGKSTRLIEYLEDDKEYLATVQFGKNTDTYDLDGEVVATFDKKVILFGSEGNAKVFSSSYRSGAIDPQAWQKTNMPKAIIEVVEPIALASKVVEPGDKCCCCCEDTEECCEETAE